MGNSARFGQDKCPCSGEYQARSVEVRTTVGGKVVVLKDVPQGACPLCGSRVYKAEYLRYIESILWLDAVSQSINRPED